MKKLLNTIILVLVAVLAYYASLVSGSAVRDCVRLEDGYCDVQAADRERIADDIHDFRGLVAYNALRGTSVRIEAMHRQELACRNSFQNFGYNSPAAKRQISQGFKNSLENAVNQYFQTNISFYRNNFGILQGGISSNSDRIHLLRVLII